MDSTTKIVCCLFTLSAVCYYYVSSEAPQNSWSWGQNPNNSQLNPDQWPSLGGKKSQKQWVRPPTTSAPQPVWLLPNNKPSIVKTQQKAQNNHAGYQNGNSANPSASNTLNFSSLDSDDELRAFSELLLSKDINNAAKFVQVNYQGKTTSRSNRDEAPLPLLSIKREAYATPSIDKLVSLFNNYVLAANVKEENTPQEKMEENNLLEVVLNTPIMEATRVFLEKKGKVSPNPHEFRNLLREIWFTMYFRGGGQLGSSGFEHVFLAELKNNQVSGLHNWIYFFEEEKNNRANYLGYMKKIDLGSKGAILKYHFTFHGVDKPVGGMFIGTSPELEMALYTTCFVLRADRVCPLMMNGHRFTIRTFTYRYRGKNMIGSAFPEI